MKSATLIASLVAICELAHGKKGCFITCEPGQYLNRAYCICEDVEEKSNESAKEKRAPCDLKCDNPAFYLDVATCTCVAKLDFDEKNRLSEKDFDQRKDGCFIDCPPPNVLDRANCICDPPAEKSNEIAQDGDDLRVRKRPGKRFQDSGCFGVTC